MDKLILFVPKLEATADPRVKTGLLLPFTEPGLTNLGKVTAAKGALRLAEKPNPLTLEHADKLPVADFVAFDEQDDGLHCAVRYLDTPMGNAALAEFDAGTRTGLSVEVDQPVIRAGRLTAGVVSGGSQVEDPAFPTARLAAAEAPVAPDMGDQPADPAPDGPPAVVIDGAELPNVSEVTVTPDEIAIKTEKQPPAVSATKKEEEPNMTAATVVQTPALVAGTKKDTSKNALFASLAKACSQGLSGARLTAALSDIVSTDILGIDQGQFIGQLWDGAVYTRRYIPAFNHADLTSMTVKGWKFVDGKKPVVSKYTGDKTAIPSNAVQTEPVEVDAYRYAGGWDIDRKYRDFSNEAFWSAFFAAVTEDAKLKSDLYAFEDILDAASVVEPGVVPDGVDPGLAAVTDGILYVLGATRTMPDGAFVAMDLWRTSLLTRAEDVLPMLNAALGFEQGTLKSFSLQPSPDLGDGQVLVKARNAATVHELGGEAPIRVEAQNIAQGGIDEAVFGYQAVNIHNADGLALVTVEGATTTTTTTAA